VAFDFDAFLARFRSSPEYQEMERTVEDSPWHREANVAVHTEMVLEQYNQRFAPHRTEDENLVSRMALLFHDVGKPSAEEVVQREDGSVYRRYAGHEGPSANGFMDAYLRMGLREHIRPLQARAIRWLIEHHLPYGYKDKQKRLGLKIGTISALDEVGLTIQTFYDVLRSDAAGRISDDHEQKLAAVEDWIHVFDSINATPMFSRAARNAYILIGPSGSGKTTFRNGLRPGFMSRGISVISADDTKEEWFTLQTGVEKTSMPSPEFYDLAWRYCTIDHGSEFDKYFVTKMHETFKRAAHEGHDVVVDVVNSSRKRRAMFVQTARQHAYHVVAAEFWNSFGTLLARQQTRTDKHVVERSVRAQYDAVRLAWLGDEVDQVLTIIGE
jgi:predicted kinase